MKTLLVLTGPTAVGKTDLALSLAKAINSPIINADSRQIFREIPIGTAAPTPEQLQLVKHYFVATKSITENYNAGQYENDCLLLLQQLFQTHNTLLLTGGAMMYIHALCHGLDYMPQTNTQLRTQLNNLNITQLQQKLLQLDPTYYQQVDLQNTQRLIHALEVSITAGVPYSTLRTNQPKQRDFKIIQIVLNRPRTILYQRINNRVEQMFTDGLEQEAHNLYHLRSLNPLNTVGYKELFCYFDGQINKQEAINLIKQNTRHYAKRQLTWFRNHSNQQPTYWLNAEQTTTQDILKLLQ